MLIRTAVVLLAFGLAGCGTLSDQTRSLSATDACAQSGRQLAVIYGSDARVVGAFGVTAAQMAAWEERVRTDGGPQIRSSRWRARQPSEQLSVCYYEGAFTGLHRPAPPGQTTTDYSRILVVVDGSGKADLLTAGTTANVPLTDPSRP